MSPRWKGGALVAIAVCGGVAGIAARPLPEETWSVMLSGDAEGYLSPCGCTSPMQGGMKRRGTALRGEGRIVRLDNGGLAGGLDRQNTMKAETAAQALDESKVDGANFGAREAKLGEREAFQLVRLSAKRLLSTSVRPSATAFIEPWREAGPFLIGGAAARPDILARELRETAMPPHEAAHRLVEEANGRGLMPLLLFDGDRAGAEALALAEPALRLVTYRATGSPPSTLERVGACALATPGERGKSVVRLTWREGGFVASFVQTLGPTIRDDPEAKRLYDAYLRDVARSGLLDDGPHVSSTGFVGSARCASCHAKETKVWEASGHAHALATLERENHGRDPDCVPCHVTGVSRHGAAPTIAFRSRQRTPRLGDVGCESCHGAGASHSALPQRIHFPRIGRETCTPCHSLENSPNFTFERYWPRIEH